MRRLRIDCGFKIKAADDDGHIEGLGAVFGNVDLGLDRIEPGAFTETIKANGELPMLWQHFSDVPIGLWEDLREVRKGLRVSGQINLDTQAGREARALVKQGAVKGLSIGYMPRDFEFEDDVRILKRVDLFEVSLATFPMNTEARVAGVKNDTPKELERSLREDYGLSKRAAMHVAHVIRNGPDGDHTWETHDHEGEDKDIRQLAGMLKRLRTNIEDIHCGQ